MIGKILINNALVIGCHALFCIISGVFIAVTASIGISIESPQLHTIFVVGYSIIFLLLYYLCGRFVLRNTYDVGANLLSVGALVFIIFAGVLFTKISPSFGMVNMPFYPILVEVYYSETPESLHMIVQLLVAPLPSLAMWIGMITTKLTASG
ncbi:MAG: hypothetical protein FWH04_03985 [Oscillospiraceae bacterium]|nr:hypothetical protein [Oscillospiraceae bacterium]